MGYGLEVRNSDNSLALNTNRTFSRFVKRLSIDRDFSGSILVPEFDDTLGAFVIYQRAVRYKLLSNGAGQETPDTDPDSGSTFYTPVATMPSFFWNNSAKTLSVTPAPSPGTNPKSHLRGDVTVIFLHYR